MCVAVDESPKNFRGPSRGATWFRSKEGSNSYRSMEEDTIIQQAQLVPPSIHVYALLWPRRVGVRYFPGANIFGGGCDFWNGIRLAHAISLSFQLTTVIGIQVVLFVSCASILYSQYSRSLRSSSSFLIKGDTRALSLLLYITLLFVIESIYTAVQARTVQLMYIDNRNYPGGPWAYFLAMQNLPVNVNRHVMFYATLFVLTFLSDFRVPHFSMRTNGDTVIRMCLIKGTTWIKVTAIHGNA
ncbi:uncharacterized protein LACBIDRAFT_330286 [Laccaria bicolor S238N-H82]|uniref:Predicted protein n=1 Tax=Laccaria bicolor (strain S238N-H82 / ATCC MYA-4686) TaxID=486041 RepID=B0DKT6_LACBS|nr:uncharacterized protein LACBIDRAFT_330286 [Laccaria bicolor S238N-H82]EDR04795.1 predicted protein [Laccaria bicolor S238N-H82]|eukprot:XP_001884619.1 predicted protein [Laccaria bicolor S238N-H82]